MQTANFMTVDADGQINLWAQRPCLEPSIGVWVGAGYVENIQPEQQGKFTPLCVALG